ncbi:MAG TPA: malto-oligosyltrehalose trehalohydrolase [Steroidobacteraceae bacterium]|nr:malto-oligosyltrehalose trehalohydrolase [Steroidobacteraceae bacterium]
MPDTTTRSVHTMPFGAEVCDGGVRFRLWAPAARRVELLLADRGEHACEMRARGGGWFELLSDVARTGSRYRYRIDGGLIVPDPASRFNPEDVHGPSMVIDPGDFAWTDATWCAPPWYAAVVYELHTGTFSPEGTFAGIESRLDHLVQLGITALELMPVADFPGRYGWGYDGVLPFAPDSSYGTPEMLKALVNSAHRRGLAVMLDVVYNHFGPEGNYLYAYAPQFFTQRHQTPWGRAINFDGPESRVVRDFFIHNACYWLEEYHFDGLRLDAVHAIYDDNRPDILTEIARTLRAGPGRERPLYLVLENVRNQARYLAVAGEREHFDAQWNDDEHHCLHVILTGETDGYYADYATVPRAMLARCLAEGFAYQGEISHYREDQPRGEPSAGLPPTAFVAFLQNHDQIGNRAFGERLCHLVKDEGALRAALAIVLLAPSPPLLFMGEEWGAGEPFPYFCDFGPELAAKVREGRRREFARFARFGDDSRRPHAPDPCATSTFESAQLRWEAHSEPRHVEWLHFYRRLLTLRHREIAPLVPVIEGARRTASNPEGAFAVEWPIRGGAMLHLVCNLNGRAVPAIGQSAGRTLFTTHPEAEGAEARRELAAWSVTWRLDGSNGP